MTRSHQNTGGNKHPAYMDPETYREADLRLIDLDRDIRIMEAQLGDPRMSEGKTPTQWGIWRSSTLKAMAWKKSEYKLIKLWVKDEKQRRNNMLLRDNGVDDPDDPIVLLANVHRVAMTIIKRLDAQFVLEDDEWRILDKAKAIVRGD